MVDFDTLSKISHNTSMIDVLKYYGIEIHPAGTDRVKTICPFHDDHNPSMVVYINDKHINESFCCYVDNTAGDPFHFIRTMEDDFNQAWVVLCKINGIPCEDIPFSELDKLLLPQKQYEESRSINSINFQISTMYRDFYKQRSKKIDDSKKKELSEVIEKRLQQFDQFLSNSPSYSDVHQYYKTELSRLKNLQSSF